MRRFSFSLFNKLPTKEFRITFSTMVTLFRIALVPCIVSAMVLGKWGVAFSLFVTASVTDLLDGNIARLFNQKTFLGACLDPLADKLLLVSCFATLAWTDHLPFVVPLWFVCLVLFRELLMIFGFLYIHYTKGFLDVQPTFLGKVTTTLQMIFIMWLFACYFYGWLPTKTYYLSLYSVTGLIVVSFIGYAQVGIGVYRNGVT